MTDSSLLTTTLMMMTEEDDLPGLVSISEWGGSDGRVVTTRPGQDLPNFMRLDLVREVVAEACRLTMMEALGQVADASRSNPSPQASMPLTQLEMAMRRHLKAGPQPETVNRIEKKITDLSFPSASFDEDPGPA